jgi:dATP pyrophosphohydrolase
MRYKIPVSVLVVVHTRDLQVLLIERARFPGYWQSVTGALDAVDEPPLAAAARELREETGIDAGPYALTDWKFSNTFEIFEVWRHRYAPGVRYNVEHVFSLGLDQVVPVRLAPEEHTAFLWLPWEEAAARCFSWSNRDAILALPARVYQATQGGNPSPMQT